MTWTISLVEASGALTVQELLMMRCRDAITEGADEQRTAPRRRRAQSQREHYLTSKRDRHRISSDQMTRVGVLGGGQVSFKTM